MNLSGESLMASQLGCPDKHSNNHFLYLNLYLLMVCEFRLISTYCDPSEYAVRGQVHVTSRRTMHLQTSYGSSDLGMPCPPNSSDHVCHTLPDNVYELDGTN